MEVSIHIYNHFAILSMGPEDETDFVRQYSEVRIECKSHNLGDQILSLRWCRETVSTHSTFTLNSLSLYLRVLTISCCNVLCLWCFHQLSLLLLSECLSLLNEMESKNQSFCILIKISSF